MRPAAELYPQGPENADGVLLFDQMRKRRADAHTLCGHVVMVSDERAPCGSFQACEVSEVIPEHPEHAPQQPLIVGMVIGCPHVVLKFWRDASFAFADWPAGDIVAAFYLVLKGDSETTTHG